MSSNHHESTAHHHKYPNLNMESLYEKFADFRPFVGRCNHIALAQRGLSEAFAKTAFDEPRKVGNWKTFAESPRHHHHADFQLVNGRQWYEVWLSADCRYWTIEAKMQPA